MAKKEMANATTTNATKKYVAKVQNFGDNIKDLTKVLDYFKYTTGTTLDCMLATGVLRNSITWYVAFFENLGELQAICRKPDRHTGRLAKYYSADPSQWRKTNYQQLTIFGKEEFV